MQDCAKYDIMISARLDGTLNKKDARELDKHLASCADCRKYLQLLEDMKEALREDLPDPPETLRSGIMNRIGREKHRKLHYGALGRWTAIAAVLCVAIFGVVKLTGSGVMKAASPSVAAVDTADKAVLTTAGASGGSTLMMSDSLTTEENSALPEEPENMAPAPAAVPMPEPTAADAAAGGKGDPSASDGADEGNGVPTTEAETPRSVYLAESLRGYALAQAVLAEGDYWGVCVFYDELPESLIPGRWQTLIPEDGEKARWLLSAEELQTLENGTEWNEFYYGDLNADGGLVIVIAGEEE